jgi:hypothetical protein
VTADEPGGPLRLPLQALDNFRAGQRGVLVNTSTSVGVWRVRPDQVHEGAVTTVEAIEAVHAGQIGAFVEIVGEQGGE